MKDVSKAARGKSRTNGSVENVAITIGVRRLPISRSRIEQKFHAVVKACVERQGSRVESLSVVVVGDGLMRRLNREFHATDETTDVLAFPFREGRVIDAEIVVCAPYAKRESASRGIAWVTELLLYVAHGVLHLTGEDDATSVGARRMRRLEREVLRRCSLLLPASHLEELKHREE